MKVSLVVLSAGKASGQTIPVALPQFVIGRDPQCNLRPASPLISKRHCAVKVRQGKVFVEDYGSTNGTFLNEVAVKGEVLMKDGDLLKAGPLSFRLAIEGQPAANLTPTNKNLPLAVAPAPTATGGQTTTAAQAAAELAPAPTATKKPASVSGKPSTPAPAKASIPPGESSEDDLAAMFLSSDGDGESTSLDDSQVPGGSTIMDLPIPPEVAAAAAAGETKPETPAKTPTPLPQNRAEEAAAPEAKKPEPKKNDAGSARDAAKALLEKMYRRGRPGA